MFRRSIEMNEVRMFRVSSNRFIAYLPDVCMFRVSSDQMFVYLPKSGGFVVYLWLHIVWSVTGTVGRIFQTNNKNIFELLQTNSTFISNQIWAGTIIGSTGDLVRALSGIWLQQCGYSRHSISSPYIIRHTIYPISGTCTLNIPILKGEIYKFMVKDPDTTPFPLSVFRQP